MQNIIRHLTKSKADKQAELISAYLDQALPASARQQFQQALAGDADLQAEVRQQQAVKAAIRQLPRQRAPRSFTLDPALYGRAQFAPTWQPFPVLRAATAMMALLLVAVLAFDLGVVQRSGLSQTAGIAMTQVDEESFAAESAEDAALAPAAGEEAMVEEPAPETFLLEPAAATVMVTEEAVMAAAEATPKEGAPEEGAVESESAGDTENSLGMPRILTETVAAPAASPTPESTPLPTPTATALPTAAAIAAAPAATTAVAPAANQAITPLPPAQPAPVLSSRDLFLITEIFLGAALLALALATWRARRRL